MKPMKKNRFFTFIFSLLPGAAEMYMGFMKNGLSLMCLFFAACGLLMCVRFDFMMAVIAVIWFWGFFHARNIAGLDDEHFSNYEDRYIWEEYLTPGTFDIKSKTLRTVFAAFIILIGLGMAWDYIMDIVIDFIPGDYWDTIYPIFDNIPSLVIGIALIIAGVVLIKGKKKELLAIEQKEEIADGESNKNA